MSRRNGFWSVVVILIICSTFGSVVASAQGTYPLLRAAHRETLGGDLLHYSYHVQLSPDVHDMICVHRVIKRSLIGHPERLPDAVMFFPGLPTYFKSLYIEPLISDISSHRSIAVFLASHGIDVWGMDYRWSLVPADTTDFGFMWGWGVDQDVSDAYAALAFARSMRTTDEQFLLTGLSYGALMTYAVAGADSQLPASERMVRGIIPMDMAVKYDDPDARATSCEWLAYDQVRLASSNTEDYVGDDGIWLSMFGDLALSDPDGESPFLPGFTNAQFALIILTSPNGPVPWHFMGGEFDQDGVPYDLLFTEPQLAFDVLKWGEPPYYPWRLNYDMDAAACEGTVDVPFDDHLADIDVPIFYVGAAGGFGSWGLHTLGLTGSADVETLIVQELDPDDWWMDVGHADLLTEFHARTKVWKPILDWIKAHR